jgi:6-phosphogluconolactonase
MRSPVPPTDRVSLNLAALLRSRLIVLLITGEEKWRVYQHALQKGNPLDMPVRAILRQDEVPVEVYWSP